MPSRTGILTVPVPSEEVMIKFKSALLILTLAVFLAACDAGFAGLDFNTTVHEDGSAVTVISAGIIPPEDDDSANEVDCSLDEAPAGLTVDTQFRGSEIWCIYTMPTDDLDALRDFYGLFGEEIFKVNCLQFVEDRFVYDLDFLSAAAEESDDGISGSTGTMTWQMTVPGPIDSHNADTQDGNLLTWAWDISSSPEDYPFNVRVNLAEGEICPSGILQLQLFIEEDGTGSATLVVPMPDGLGEQLVSDVEGLGWSISAVTDDGRGPGRIEAERRFSSEAELNKVIQGVPGLNGSSASFGLDITEVEGTGQRIYEFSGRHLDMAAYQTYWAGLAEDLAPPDFHFQAFPPGDVASQSGAWTFPRFLILEWNAQTGPGTVQLAFESVLEPDRGPVDDEEIEASLETIKNRFLTEIPVGQIVANPTTFQNYLAGFFPPGWVNNWTNGQNFACGDYQTRVLKWLDEIRLSPDPEVRNLLRGLDYGPIQAYSGGHQAVAIFPKGSDWRTRGTVLDPWPNQIPQTFTMKEWEARFPRGIGPGQGAENFPHMYGGDSFYRSNPAQSDARQHTRQIGVNSPVDVLIVASDGRQLGVLADGSLVNDIPTADFYVLDNGDGSKSWLFGLPAGEYEMRITGTGEGEYHVLAGDGQGTLVAYPAQEVAVGDQATLPINQDTMENNLATAAGTMVAPVPVTEQNLDSLDLGRPRPEAIPTEASGLGAVLAEIEGAPRSGLLALGGLAALGMVCVAGLVVAGAGFVVILRRR